MPKKKMADGRTTTTKGGRPVDQSKRRLMQAEVVRLRTLEGLTFTAAAERVGCSFRHAQNLYYEFMAAEIGLTKKTVDQHRAENGAVLERLRDMNCALACNTKIKVTKDDPDLGSIDLADFEKTVKCSKVAIDAAVAHAKLFGCNAAEEHNITGGLSLAQFAAMAEAGDVAARR